MTKIDYIYTEGIEAIYINNELEVVDELIDIDRLLDILLGKNVIEVNKYYLESLQFEYYYHLQMPKLFNNISKDHLIEKKYLFNKDLN